MDIGFWTNSAPMTRIRVRGLGRHPSESPAGHRVPSDSPTGQRGPFTSEFKNRTPIRLHGHVGIQGGRAYQKQKAGRRIEQTGERRMGGRCRWCRQLATFAICPEEIRLTTIRITDSV